MNTQGCLGGGGAWRCPVCSRGVRADQRYCDHGSGCYPGNYYGSPYWQGGACGGGPGTGQGYAIGGYADGSFAGRQPSP